MCQNRLSVSALSLEIEQIGGADLLMRQSTAGADDGGDAATRRLHASHPDAQQMLAAVSGLPRKMRRFDAAALEELLQLRRHVQYPAL